MDGAVAGSSEPATSLPTTGIADLLRLAGSLAGELARRGNKASVRRAVRGWSEDTSTRLGSRSFMLKVGPKRVVLVGDVALSRCILHARPGAELGTGKTKRDAMRVLAPNALTISDGDDWERRRRFNEFVLDSGRMHSLAFDFYPRVCDAFRGEIVDVDTTRNAMRRTMLALVFGPGVAADVVATDLEYLSALVQNPLRRLAIGRFAGARRARFRQALRTLWHAAAVGPPSLLQRARTFTEPLGEEEALDQIPHWMFTFTGSGSDLLSRTLWLVLSDDAIRTRVIEEVGRAGGVETLDALPLLTACLLESAQLYPPVTRAFHRTTSEARLGGVSLPADTEIVHWFPHLEAAELGTRRFNPDRWNSNHSVANEPFDPFLSGARHCPGMELILLVCKIAISQLLIRNVRLAGQALDTNVLPLELEMDSFRLS